jgi:hypothetical protein
MRKRIFILFFVFLTSQLFFGQQNSSYPVKLPDIIPPNPETAKLLSANNISNNLTSGTASISIPLYTIKCGSINVPISANYSTNGFLVDEIAGVLGMGWSLNAGGAITRKTNGKPDELTYPLAEPPSFSDYNQQLLNYLHEISNDAGSYDNSKDFYRYDIGEFSASFIKNGNTYQQVPTSRNKIQFIAGAGVNNYEIKITSTSGTIYTFGGTYREITNTYKSSRGSAPPRFPNITTTWFIRKIEDVNGNVVNFYYDAVYPKNYTSLIMTATKNIELMCDPFSNCSNIDMTNATTNHFVSYVDYNSYKLTNITTNKGISVNFNYENLIDASDNKRVKTIVIKEYGIIMNNYEFNYTEQTQYQQIGYLSSISTQINQNKRFFLNAITDKIGNIQHQYSFEYNDINGLPYRLSMAQDKFGYYNGKNNQTLYINNQPFMTNIPNLVYADRNSDFQYAQKGLLNKIIYPTGGSQSFIYEDNGGFGGVRVKEIHSNDKIKITKKRYSYNNPIAGYNPTYVTFSRSALMAPGSNGEHPPGPSYLKSASLSSNSLESSYLNDSRNVNYLLVKEEEFDVNNNTNGYSEHIFEATSSNTAYIMIGEHIPYTPKSISAFTESQKLETKIYNSNNQLLKKEKYYYLPDSREGTISFFKNYRFNGNQTIGTYYGPTPQIMQQYDVNEYFFNSTWRILDKIENFEYDNNGTELKNTTSYVYNNLFNLQPTEKNTTNSLAQVVKETYTYPNDYTSLSYPPNQHPYQKLIANNLLNIPIETKTFKNTTQISLIKTNYKVNTNNSVPDYVETALGNNTPKIKQRFEEYTSTGQPLQLKKESNINVSYVWSWNNDKPTFEATNAKFHQIAFTSFESFEGNGNWVLNGGELEFGFGFSGNQCYNLTNGNITNNLISSRNNPNVVNVVVEYWEKNGSGTSTVNTQLPNILNSFNGWTHKKILLPVTSIYTISGTAIIDDLRIYPENAIVKALIYQPGKGIIATADVNNRYNYFTYDGFNRLSTVKNQDGNIIKKICYKYDGQPEDCGLFYSIAMSQSFIRNNCPPGETGSAVLFTVTSGMFTSAISQADADQQAQNYVNANGQAYANTNGSCTPVPSCGWTTCMSQGEAYQCINGVCEQGVQVYTSSYLDPNTGTIMCEYHYEYSDGSWSATYTVASGGYCAF